MAHSVDLLVGKRIRMRRAELSLTQTELANRLGLTFQQIQKYETGNNRISCGRLAALSQALDVPITYFFETGTKEKQRALFDELDVSIIKDARRLLTAFQKIPNGKTRHLAIALLKEMGSSAKADRKKRK